MDIVKLSLIGISGVFLGFLMKQTKPEYAYLITLGIGIIILSLAVGKMYYLYEAIARLRLELDMNSGYMTTLMKMLGITYIGQFSSGICKDAGYSSTGMQIELFCKLSIMVLSMPILLALLETIQGFFI